MARYRWGVRRAVVILIALAVISLVIHAGRVPKVSVDGTNEDDTVATKFVNDYRAGLGLPVLSKDAGLDTEARRWAEHLASTNSLSHDGLKLNGWSEVGENVGRGATIEVIEQAFEDSPTHEHNLSGDYTHLGVAVAVRGEVTWIVQRFGTRAQAPPPVTQPAPTVTLVPATTATLAPPVLCRQVSR